MTARTIRFAGSEATVGLLVLGTFLLFLVLGTAGVTALLVTGVVPRSPMLVVGLGLLIMATAFFGRVVHRSWRQFRTLVVDPDGAWHLKNPMGVRLFTLAPGDLRAVDWFEADAWMFIGVARKYKQTWVQIETPEGRRFSSTRSTPQHQAGAQAELQRVIDAAGAS